MSISFISKYCVFIVVLFCVFNFSSAIKLNPNGGYEVSIAINEMVESRGQSYVSTIEGIFQTLSGQLFRSTNGTFFIQNVNIIVPNSWTTDAAPNPVKDFKIATIESFETSDVQISDNLKVPYVQNPNLCGRAGEFMQFPTEFFSKKTGGTYGEAWKALLTQWARYRWGVWEEHGYPGDTQFPYFSKESPKQEAWKVTGCSNVEILGKYVNEYGETDKENCDLQSENALKDVCRFIPSPVGNTATSSLMHFHSLESVTDFCDETTHSRTALNKQNLFCGYKSVWEIIRETQDYKTVTSRDASGSLPAVKFNTFAIGGHPALYILLDKGATNLPETVKKINRHLSELFKLNSIQPILTSLATFPSGEPGSYIQEQVKWTPVSSNQDAFIRATETEPASDAPVDRDFGLAILEAVENIKRKNLPSGTVLLIVKTGAGKDSFGKIIYEEEVRGALLNERIKLITAEVEMSRAEPYVNLASLSEFAGEKHTRITGANSDYIIQDIIKEIENLLKNPISSKTSGSILIYKGQLLPDTRVSVLLRSNLAGVNFSLTAPANADISYTLPDGTIVYSDRPEWDEILDTQKRIVKLGTVYLNNETILDGRDWNFKYECATNCANIKAYLTIHGTFNTDPNPEVLDISAYTSAVDNIVNLNDTKDSDVPFSIFARTSLQGVPVTNLTVQALIQNSGGGSESWSVNMVDDGLGNPDIAKNDGIYSGSFIPPVDGSYKIRIRVVNDEIRTPQPTSRIIPIDQNELGCANANCKPISLTKLFETTQDLTTPISVTNRNLLLLGKPTRIIGLNTIFEKDQLRIRVQFSPPKIVGVDSEQASGVQYYIYFSKTMDELLGNLSNPAIDYRVKDANLSTPIEDFFINDLELIESSIIFAAIQTFNRNNRSEISNIKSVYIPGRDYTGPPTTGPTEEITTKNTDTTQTTTVSTESTINTDSTTSNPVDPPPSSTPVNEDKAFFKTAWGIVVIVAIVLAVLVAGAGIFYYCCRVRGIYKTKENIPETQLPARPISANSGNSRENP